MPGIVDTIKNVFAAKGPKIVPKGQIRAKRDAGVKLYKKNDIRPHAERFGYTKTDLESVAQRMKDGN